MVDNYEIISTMREYADQNNVPIILNDSLEYIVGYIKKNNIKNILEIGTAIGYSAIMMALSKDDLIITTIERDEKRYLEAIKNIKKASLEDRITLIYSDAEQVNLEGTFDLIFIDASKSQNIKFFEKFSKNLSSKGTIITDNINFHGLTEKKGSEIESRNLRGLVRKINAYIDYLKTNPDFHTEFLNIGDGLSVSIKNN